MPLKTALKRFRLTIVLKINRDHDNFFFLPVGKPYRLKHAPIEPRPHLDHLGGEICPAQRDLDRTYIRLPLVFNIQNRICRSVNLRVPTVID